jgi:hypothetical protein
MSNINVTVTNAGAASVAVSGGSTVNATVGNGGAVNVSTGTISPGNANVVSGTLAINSVTTLAAGSQAYVKNDAGTAFAAKLDIGIPAGPATSVIVGKTTTLAAGSSATVTGTTDIGSLSLAFGIPAGSNGTNGVTPNITASATTLSAGSSATVTATPSNGGADVALAFGIPRGADGAAGAGGGASLSDATPAALGTASAGTSSLASRADHVHATPVISYANLTNVPSTFAPSTHTHTASAISDFATEAAKYGPVASVAGRTGTITLAQLGSSGTASASTFLRGDGAWAAAGSTSASDLTTGTLSSDRLPLATTSVAGAVIVGTGLAISSGVLSASGSDDLDGGWFYGSSGLSRSITITSPPTNKTASSGAATFSVTAIADPSGAALSYQWQKSDASGFSAIQRTLPTLRAWGASAYGNGVFVALASGSGVAATSTDGVTWTERTLPSSADWQSVTFGGGVFVAVAYGTAIAATSTDGVTWTQRTLPNSRLWNAVAYGNGMFVTMAYNTSVAATSSDGITWTERTLPMTANWSSITYGNGTFVAVALGNLSTATSSDGVTWTQRFNSLPSLSAGEGFWSVAYGNGIFVVVGYGATGPGATSTDGITWTQRTLPSLGADTSGWDRVAFGDGVFLAVSTYSIAATSADGIAWTSRTLPTSGPLYGVAYGAGTFVALRYNSQAAATIQLSAQTNFANVSGATSSTLALTGLTSAADNGDRFRVVVSAANASSVTSEPATLTVS